MKTIPLTQGKVAFVDDENYERLAQFNWKNNVLYWFKKYKERNNG